MVGALAPMHVGPRRRSTRPSAPRSPQNLPLWHEGTLWLLNKLRWRDELGAVQYQWREWARAVNTKAKEDAYQVRATVVCRRTCEHRRGRSEGGVLRRVWGVAQGQRCVKGGGGGALGVWGPDPAVLCPPVCARVCAPGGFVRTAFATVNTFGQR